MIEPNSLKANSNKNQVADSHTIADVGQKTVTKVQRVATISGIALVFIVVLAIILILKRRNK